MTYSSEDTQITINLKTVLDTTMDYYLRNYTHVKFTNMEDFYEKYI